MTNLVDMLKAFQFGSDQASYHICQDLEKKVCDPTNDANCLVFKNDLPNKTWDTPFDIDTSKPCTDVKDCSGIYDKCAPDPGNAEGPDKYCQWAPQFGTDVFSGTCHIASENLCNTLSKLPYSCNEEGCKTIPAPADPDKNPQMPYVEWRDGAQCTDDTNCNFPSVCKDGQCTCNSNDQCPGSSKCQNGTCQSGGRCIFGNYLLKQYCENPITRCVPDSDGNLPQGCKTQGIDKGITDVPPFHYNQKTGQCSITSSYCSYFDFKYNDADKQCSTTQPCADPQKSCASDGFCSGAGSGCDTPTGEKVAEFFVGKTIFEFFSHGSCKDPGAFAAKLLPGANGILGLLNKTPEKIFVNVDQKNVLYSKLIVKDMFKSDVSLYLIYSKLSKEPYVGVLSKEVKKGFPGAVVLVDNQETVVLRKSELKNNEVKRLFAVLAISKEITRDIFKINIK